MVSGFKIGLPKKAVLQLELKMIVERRKATQWDSARVENVGRPLRKSTEPKVRKQLEFCKE